MKKEKFKGEQQFDQYYQEVYGQRWPSIKASLVPEVKHASISYDGMEPYFLDPASVVCALCLPLDGAEKVLDLCAAPGGKTLMVAGNLPENALLFSNERSPQRKGRLVKVVEESLPVSIAERVRCSCSDGSTWCRRESECYDSILLDAPCSSERHVLNDPKYLDDWTPSRIKTVSMEEWALLSCAFRLLKKGGWLLYATCALAPKENDGNIKKLLQKFPEAKVCPKDEMEKIFRANLASFRARLSSPEGMDFERIFSCAEDTEFGLHVIPDLSMGAGPLYFCLVKKE